MQLGLCAAPLPSSPIACLSVCLYCVCSSSVNVKNDLKECVCVFIILDQIVDLKQKSHTTIVFVGVILFLKGLCLYYD